MFLYMIITQYDLKNLKNECQRIVDLVSYISNTDDYKDLFSNRQSYEDAKKIKLYVPEEFYNFRLFDVYTCIKYNSKIKKYMIELKGYYSNILDKYKTNQRSTTSFIISESLDETIELWKDIVIDSISQNIKHNGLF